MSVLNNVTVPGGLLTELANRAKTTIGLWDGGKAAWVHMMSFSDKCTPTYGIIQSNGNPEYTAKFQRPTPNIKSLKVAKQGELGTTRKCTIELQAWTDEQLNSIAQCYFLPGMSVRVQFGWNIDSSGTRAQPPIEALLRDSEANCQIFERAGSDACYDGFQGKVTNYQYSLNVDGGWDITLEIISAAAMLAETKVDGTANNCECKARGGDSEVPVSNIDIITSLQTMLPTNDSPNELKNLGLSNDHWAVIRYNTPGRTAFGEEKTGFMAWLSNTFDSDVEESFITVRAFHEIINSYGKPDLFGKIDNKGVKLQVKHPSYLMSSDPRVCYVPGARLSDRSIVSVMKGSPAAALVGNELILDNVLINCIFLVKCIKELGDQSESEKGLSLQTLLQSIHNTINAKLGNLWNIEILDASGNCTTEEPMLQIVDVSSAESNTPIQVEPAGYNPRTSIVRDFKLETKLTDAMKSMALYAYTPNQGNSDPCLNKFEAFRQNKAANLTEPKAETTEAKGSKIDCTLKSNESLECENKPDIYEKFFKSLTELKKEVISDTVGAFEAARSGLIGKLNETGKGNCPTILPFEFSFTLDGIGGFKFGQYVTHPRIPEGIRNQLKFQVTSVEHQISDTNDWTTTVNTIARFNSK
jgi:hypothetical protein